MLEEETPIDTPEGHNGTHTFDRASRRLSFGSVQTHKSRTRSILDWIIHHKLKLFAASVWVVIIIAFFVAIRKSDQSVGELIFNSLTTVGASKWGSLVFVVLYVARLILFIPGTALTILGGFLFGAWKGLLLVLIGANLSATCAYYIGSYFGNDLFDNGARSHDVVSESSNQSGQDADNSADNDSFLLAGGGDSSTSTIHKYTHRLRQNAFETVLIMRLIFLPFDLVSYLAGFLRVGLWPFILATAIGILPGALSFILLGASSTPEEMKQFVVHGHLPKLDWRALAGSVAMLVISLLVSRVLKSRRDSS
ncbi:hypothetical protein SARC_01545 [Sphaeroforma arctica JP610]|uniref:VTT domain-containing protein n=1 Tax=Sphaeroforma arctica JP610 TaxID=667725 RepID=A0A0L0GDF6_9EUKA|nr:hypothetical protein SARC_01545 [Sphaeroforma arctica JP610]KNC86283.1 hypothetical protein SARC_01545 [Sphaeroforma arctica JP610]|eukprot:XP_014160185.1 hypothetical protein SARC_01545 [Sphaeroforma arctica JP610]